MVRAGGRTAGGPPPRQGSSGSGGGGAELSGGGCGELWAGFAPASALLVSDDGRTSERARRGAARRGGQGGGGAGRFRLASPRLASPRGRTEATSAPHLDVTGSASARCNPRPRAPARLPPPLSSPPAAIPSPTDGRCQPAPLESCHTWRPAASCFGCKHPLSPRRAWRGEARRGAAKREKVQVRARCHHALSAASPPWSPSRAFSSLELTVLAQQPGAGGRLQRTLRCQSTDGPRAPPAPAGP